MKRTTPQVDGFIRKSAQWQEELRELRSIILECAELTEEMKWRVPFYTFQEKNVVFLGRFKDCCTLSFVKGALLKDAKGVLVKPGENTQAGRVIRFTDVKQIVNLEPGLKAYIHEAVEVERSGAKVQLKTTAEFLIPVELQTKFDERAAMKTAFRALTPGRQRAYILYFSAAKQAKTRASRIEKWTQQILDGKGLDD